MNRCTLSTRVYMISLLLIGTSLESIEYTARHTSHTTPTDKHASALPVAQRAHPTPHHLPATAATHRSTAHRPTDRALPRHQALHTTLDARAH